MYKISRWETIKMDYCMEMFWFWNGFVHVFVQLFENDLRQGDAHSHICKPIQLYYHSFFITGQISDLPSNTMILFFISVKWDQIGKSHMLRDPFLYPSQKCTDLNKCRADGNHMYDPKCIQFGLSNRKMPKMLVFLKIWWRFVWNVGQMYVLIFLR